MKNLVIPTKLTPGASREQLLIEKEMNELIIKNNRFSFICLIFALSIIGIPIALILYFAKGRKNDKRLKELQYELDELIIREASER